MIATLRECDCATDDVSAIPFPTPHAYVKLAARLEAMGYEVGRRGEIVRHVREKRTAECAPHLTPAHRAEVERSLEVDPGWNDGRWDRMSFAPSPLSFEDWINTDEAKGE